MANNQALWDFSAVRRHRMAETFQDLHLGGHFAGPDKKMTFGRHFLSQDLHFSGGFAGPENLGLVGEIASA